MAARRVLRWGSKRRKPGWRTAGVGAAVFSLLLTGMASPGAFATTTEPPAANVSVHEAGDDEGSAEGIQESAESVEESAKGAAEETVEGSVEGAAEGTAEESAEGSVEGAAEGSAETAEVDTAQDDAGQGTEARSDALIVDAEADEVRGEVDAEPSDPRSTHSDERAPPAGEGQPAAADEATVDVAVASAAGGSLQDTPYCNPEPGTAGAFQQQQRDGAWTQGNMGRGYSEGDWVPQRARLTLAPGANQFAIEFGYQNGLTIGYDDVRFTRVVADDGSEVSLDLMQVLVQTTPGTRNGTATFNFILPEGAGGTTWLHFDVHLANSLDYADQGLRGASNYAGASLHTRRLGLNCVGLGAASLSIPVGQLASGTVTVVQETDPADDEAVFDYTITGGGATLGVQLSDGGSWTSRLGSHEFTVTGQDVPPGWVLADITCTGTTASYTADSATFTLIDGADVTCTFTHSLVRLADLTVAMTVQTGYQRAYTWGIEKVAGSERYRSPEGSPAMVAYDVTVTAEDVVESEITVSGGISVDNPNALPFTVDVTDNLPGASCTVEGSTGAALTVPAGGATFAYACTGDGDGVADVGHTATATVTWDADAYPGTSGQATGTAPVTFGAPDSETHREVSVTDVLDGGEARLLLPAGDRLDWVQVTSEGGSRRFEYTQQIAGTPGTCTTYRNVAGVIADDGTGLVEDDAVVEVCVGRDLEIGKNTLLSMDRSYGYDLTKDVEQSRLNADPDTGLATFDYTVRVIDGPYRDSRWAMTGEITVTNPNDWAVAAAVSDEVLAGVDATCAVIDPERTIPGADGDAPGSATFAYSCSFDGQPDYSGTNTATVTWDAARYFSPRGEATGSVGFEVDDWSVSPINETVTVLDDQADPANVVDLGEHTWTAEGVETVYRYQLALAGVPGRCVSYPSAVWLKELPGITADEQVTVCWPEDLTVDLTVHAGYEREYLWDLTKDVDQTEVNVGAGGAAQLDYRVVTTPDGFQDSGWVMAGVVSVTNPNGQDVTATVTDVPDVGGAASCTVAEPTLVVPAGGEAATAYECTFTSPPSYTGGHSAVTVSWVDVDHEERSVSTSEDVTFHLVEETNVEVRVYDDMVTLASPGELLGTANWHDGPTEFSYSLQLHGVAGRCVDHTNTAVIPATGDEADRTVTTCVEDELVITKTADASYDREYFWDISKEVDRTEAVVPEGELAEFVYTVFATPDGFADSGWAVTGRISVTNPNTYARGEVTVSLAGSTDVGGLCAVVDGDGVVLEPGETRVLDYECSFEQQPEYEGTSTATVTWAGPDEEERSTTVAAPVAFDLATETHAEVSVYDDKATLASPGELLGLASWHDGSTGFTYRLSFAGDVGRWAYYTGTAVIAETGDTADRTVRVRVPEPPAEPPVAPEPPPGTPEPPVMPWPPVASEPPPGPAGPPVAPEPAPVGSGPPVIPTGDPVGGVDDGLLAAGIAAMLLALLGARVTLIRRTG